MTTDTFTAATDDGRIQGASNSYATARATSLSSDDTSTTADVGQSFSTPTYRVNRTFVRFDTSAIPDDAIVSAASLLITADADNSVTDFLVEVYRFAWASTLAANREADYDGAYGGSATLEGTLRDTSAGWSSGTQYSLAVDPSGVNLSGYTGYALVSSRDVANAAPSGLEQVAIRTADHGTAADRPKLEVIYTVPGSRQPVPHTAVFDSLVVAAA